MDTLSRAVATYGMSLSLLLTLILASRRNHSPAISRWFRAQIYGTIAVELAEHIAGWDSDIYTFIYIPYTLVMLVCSGLVVLEAYREPS
jgi:hypothetical protein